MLAISRHALLREQQRAISPLMALLIDECAIEWQCSSDKLIQVLSKQNAKHIEEDTKHLIRELKKGIKQLKRIEKKASARHSNMQVVSTDGMVVTEVTSRRIKRKER